MAVRYVDGSMDEPERTGFEDHFFACADCFQTVQALEDARGVLAERANDAGQSATGPLGAFGRGWPLQWMAAAATVIVVVGLSVMVRRDSRSDLPPGTGAVAQAPAASQHGTGAPSPTQTPPVTAPAPKTLPAPAPARQRAENTRALWALVVPPQYVALTTRSGQDQDAERAARTFDEAMTHYSAGRYRQAADALQALNDRTPSAPHVDFFLGISELMTGAEGRARVALRRSADSGVSPYADEAHFYLAKVAFRAGDLTTAARELELAVEREAGPEGEAARLLAELRSGR